MTDLRVILSIAGAVIIVLLFVWYKWQERRLKKRGDAAFGSRHEDILLAPLRRPAATAPVERIEPEMHAHEEAATEEKGIADPTLVAPPVVADRTPHTSAQEPTPEVRSEPEPETRFASSLPIDDRIDAVAIISAGAAEVVESAPLLSVNWSKFSKTVNRFGEETGTWGELEPGKSYQRAVIAMQLVDRKGPIPGMEFTDFARQLEELAAQYDWQLELGSSESVSKRAAELDRVCQEVDFQIAFDVVASGDKTFPGTRIRGIAEANGLKLAADGSFCRSDTGGTVWFTLKNRGATPFSPEHMREFSTRGLTLALDVPRAPREAFPAMRALLGNLCSALQGTIVDEQGRRLDEAALDLVDDQVRAIQARLEQNGIVPGSALALRLFS